MLTSHRMRIAILSEQREEWRQADCWPCNGFFPYPLGFPKSDDTT